MYNLKSHLSHDVHGAHDDLVQVPVLEQRRVLHEHVLEARPHLAAQRRVHVQSLAQVA